MTQNLEEVKEQARKAAAELLEAANLAAGSILVTGCSSSEITGGRIGKASSLETAQAVFGGIYPLLEERGIYLAAQCCEHLNRALIVEARCAERYGYEPVSVRPQPKAGGSFATAAWEAFRQPVARMIPPRRSIWSVPWWFGLPGFGRSSSNGTMAS